MSETSEPHRSDEAECFYPVRAGPPAATVSGAAVRVSLERPVAQTSSSEHEVKLVDAAFAPEPAEEPEQPGEGGIVGDEASAAGSNG